MIYRCLADLVVVTHLLFIVFAVLGGLAALRWKKVACFHLPAAVWAVLIEFFGWICPLTPLEIWLMERGGEQGYSGGFVEHYVVPIIYPIDLTRTTQFLMGGFVFVLNLTVYWFWFRKFRRAA